jgi:carbamoylphosphate synthase large subunit
MPRKVLFLGPGHTSEANPLAQVTCIQALRALAERKVASVVMTPSSAMVDFSVGALEQVYFLPTTPAFVESIIVREQPDMLLWTSADPEAFQTVQLLEQSGVLSRYGVRVMPRIDQVRIADDPDRLAQALRPLRLTTPKHRTVSSVVEARAAAEQLGYPLVVRPLGPASIGRRLLATDDRALERVLEVGLARSRHLALRSASANLQYLDFVVLADARGAAAYAGCVEHLESTRAELTDAVCAVPPVTVSRPVVHELGLSAVDVVQALQLSGAVTVRMALDADSRGRMVVDVFVRPTLSMSLLSLGAGRCLASDGVRLLTEARLEDLPGLEPGASSGGFAPTRAALVAFPTGPAHADDYDAAQAGHVVGVAPTFVDALRDAYALAAEATLPSPESPATWGSRSIGPSAPRRWAPLLARDAGPDRAEEAAALGISPAVFEPLRALLGGEASTTASDTTDAITPNLVPEGLHAEGRGPTVGRSDGGGSGVLVLSGPAGARGWSTEDDWTLFQTVRAIRRLGARAIVLDARLSSVAIGAWQADRCYALPATPDRLAAIVAREGVTAVIDATRFGPSPLVAGLGSAGIRVLGPAARSVEQAHDPVRLVHLLETLDLPCPGAVRTTNLDDALSHGAELGYPLAIQWPAAPDQDEVARSSEELHRIGLRVGLSAERPAVLRPVGAGGRLLELDGVAAEGRLVVTATSEHVEPVDAASQHSALMFPAQRTYPDVLKRARAHAGQIAAALQIHGPFSIRLLVIDHTIQVLRVLLRPSVALPFVSRSLNVDLVDVAVRVLLGQRVPALNGSLLDVDFVGVCLSAGESGLEGGTRGAVSRRVTCFGDDAQDATLKTFMAGGFQLPVRTALLSAEAVEDRIRLIGLARLLREAGVRVMATEATAEFLKTNGLEVGGFATARATMGLWSDTFQRRRFDLLISLIPREGGAEGREIELRRQARHWGIPLVGDLGLAQRFVEALATRSTRRLTSRSWAEHQGRTEIDAYASRD